MRTGTGQNMMEDITQQDNEFRKRVLGPFMDPPIWADEKKAELKPEPEPEPEKKVVAITDASGYSGVKDQPQVMAAGGPTDDDQVDLQVAQVSKARLKDEDLAMFLLLLQREKDAVDARNAHCIKIEKKYGLAGFTWTFDPKSGTIQRTGKRQPEKK